MFNPFRFFMMPEYFFNPRQGLRRFRRLWHRQQPIERMRLPWGAVVAAHTYENIGRSLYYYGIFDKVVPEAIFRLLDPGEVAVEIGANIGLNCSCMARRVGVEGTVFAFEPHPEIVSELRGNVALWPPQNFAKIQIEPVALSAEPGEAFLDLGPEFETNRGSAAIRNDSSLASGFKVRMARLDEYLRDIEQVGLCKIDVEGHELNVLRGASESLKRRAIRDIVFEDYQPQPSPVTRLLQEHGYEIFKLGEGWLKPALSAVDSPTLPGKPDTHNFLATLNSARVAARYRRWGWRSLMAF
jgi:FkbM family methyltransferase